MGWRATAGDDGCHDEAINGFLIGAPIAAMDENQQWTYSGTRRKQIELLARRFDVALTFPLIEAGFRPCARRRPAIAHVLMIDGSGYYIRFPGVMAEPIFLMRSWHENG